MLHISISSGQDRGPAFEGLAVNINEIIEHHTISDASQEVSSNELQRIEDIGYRINEDFDMFRILKNQLGVKAANAGIGSSQGPTPTASASAVPAAAPAAE